MGKDYHINLWQGWGLDSLPHPTPRGVWSGVLKAGCLNEIVGVPFRQNFSKLAGRGNSTHFWLDIWAGVVPLASRFGRLFALELNKEFLIKDRILT